MLKKLPRPLKFFFVVVSAFVAIFFILTLVVLISLWAESEKFAKGIEGTLSGKWIEYRDEDFGIKFTYPYSWKVSLKGPPFISPGKTGPYFQDGGCDATAISESQSHHHFLSFCQNPSKDKIARLFDDPGYLQQKRTIGNLEFTAFHDPTSFKEGLSAGSFWLSINNDLLIILDSTLMDHPNTKKIRKLNDEVFLKILGSIQPL